MKKNPRDMHLVCWLWGHKLSHFVPGERCHRCGERDLLEDSSVGLDLKYRIGEIFMAIAQFFFKS